MDDIVEKEAHDAGSMPSRNGTSKARRNVMLAILLLVYAMNYADRQAIGILSIPIKTELHLSDTQLGMLGGMAFAIFYTSLGVPIARLADRMNRVRIIAVALALWSVFTAFCGLSRNFVQLFLTRVGVGIGEAGGLAPSYSILSDYFPPHERARALGVLSLGVPLGAAAGLFVAGYLQTYVGWRATFLILGIVGLLLLVPLLLFVREPTRGEFDPVSPDRQDHGFVVAVGLVLRDPVFCLASLATGASAMMSYGLNFWLPAYVGRSLGLDIRHTAVLLGTATLVGGAFSMLASGWIADWLEQKGWRGYAIVPVCASIASLFLLLLALRSTGFGMALVSMTLLFAFSQAYAPPTLALIQNRAAPHMRATTAAIFLLIVNLMGAGIGPLLLGVVSDVLTGRYGPAGLGYSVAIGGAMLYLAAAALYGYELLYLRKGRAKAG